MTRFLFLAAFTVAMCLISNTSQAQKKDESKAAQTERDKVINDFFDQTDRRTQRGQRSRRGGGGRGGGLVVGEMAPTFTLNSLDGKSKTELAQFNGKKPVILFFGSYTWPPFLSSVGSMEKMYNDYKDVAEFRMIYIREAHAADGQRPAGAAIRLGINEAKNIDERCETAQRLIDDNSLTMPMLIDNMDNETNLAYSAHPDRIFLVRTDGRLAVAADRGPWGFKPGLDEAREWLEEFSDTGKEPKLTKEQIENGDRVAKAKAKATAEKKATAVKAKIAKDKAEAMKKKASDK